MSLKLLTYTNPPNYQAQKAQIAAAYNEIKLDIPAFEFHKDNATPEFLAKNPLGTVPVLETPEGCITQAHAIARYLARLRPSTNLYGTSFYESAQVDQWLEFTANEIEGPRDLWLLPIAGVLAFDQDSYKDARKDLTAALNVVNSHLQLRTFLVGNSVTLADIALTCALVELYQRVFEPNFRKQFVNLNRWFDTCINQPAFARVLGKIVLAEKEQRAKQEKGAGKQEKKKEDKPKEEKKKEEKPKEQPKKKEEAAPMDDEEEKPKEKKVHPLDLLPPSKMILDPVKKGYFEAQKHGKLPEFWKNLWSTLDREGWSIWQANYNYNAENAMLFMTSNLVGGWIQVMEETSRKYGFASIVITGKDEDTKPFNITGAFLLRGTETKNNIPIAVEEAGGSEYYTWKKLNLDAPADLNEFEQLFTAETYGGLAVLDRKMLV